MPSLPARASLAHLHKQAKDLLAAYRGADAAAIARLQASLPAAHSLPSEAIVARAFRLHDAQSCLAREYGFDSWADLKTFVEGQRAAVPLDVRRADWLRLVYGRGHDGARPAVAARMLGAAPDLALGDPIFACAVGDVAGIREAVRADPGWIHRPSGPYGMPPLVAVTHSSLGLLDTYAPAIEASVQVLLAAGADINGTYIDPQFPDAPLSALYGAAGRHHRPRLTQQLLDAGANPNDNESLYHSVETPDLTCMRLLLAAGARVPGSNALRHQLDVERLEGLQLLLAHGADPNEPGALTPLLWAIRRGRSLPHINALLDAGASPAVKAHDGSTAYEMALAFGLLEVAERLRAATGEPPAGALHRFLAACATGNEPAAREQLQHDPTLLTRLSPLQTQLLPELAAAGRGDAVRTMVAIGWPVDVIGGDWSASALNHAAMNGDPSLMRYLLAHGARWDLRHGFGDTVVGTLSWASINKAAPEGDWVGCMQALVESGVPVPSRDYDFSDDVQDYLDSLTPTAG